VGERASFSRHVIIAVEADGQVGAVVPVALHHAATVEGAGINLKWLAAKSADVAGVICDCRAAMDARLKNDHLF
jgi:hypothetical protein